MRALLIMPSIWLSPGRAAGGNIRLVEVCKRWKNIHLDSLEPKPSISLRLDAKYTVHEVDLPIHSEKIISGIGNFMVWTTRVIRKFVEWRASGKKFDVVLSGLGVSNAFHCWLAGKLFGSPLVVSVQTIGDYTPSLALSYGKWRAAGWRRLYALVMCTCEYVSSRLLRNASAFICVSKSIADDLARHDISEQRLHTSSNGVDIDRVDRVTRHVKAKDTDAVFLGRVEADKGVLDLLRAWRIVVDERKDARLILIGSGTSLQQAIKLATDLRLQDNVKFAGYVFGDQKYAYLKKSEVFLYPSRIPEGWSLSIAEAMSCALPVICYSNPVFLSIFEGCKSVFFVPDGDTKKLAETTLALLEDAPLLEKSSLLSREYVKQFDWNKIAEREFQYMSGLLARIATERRSNRRE